MKLEWKLKLLLKLMNATGFKPIHTMTPEELRARESMERNFVTDLIYGKPVELAAIEDVTITGRHGEIPLRIYKPILQDNLPVLVYYHGGGWVIGSIETHDNLCRRLAKGSGRLVISVDYRLAPEHKFPIPVDDCFDALQWVGENAAAYGGDPMQIAIGGDSAGGNLAAVIAQLARDNKGPAVEKQLLIYPAVDTSKVYPSAEALTDAPILTKKDMDWFLEHYISKEEDIYDPCCSPLLNNLADLPPAFVLTAEYDPLRDQGNRYAEALQAAGVPTKHKQYPRQAHGFVSFYRMSGQGQAAFADMASFLKG